MYSKNPVRRALVMVAATVAVTIAGAGAALADGDPALVPPDPPASAPADASDQTESTIEPPVAAEESVSSTTSPPPESVPSTVSATTTQPVSTVPPSTEVQLKTTTPPNAVSTTTSPAPLSTQAGPEWPSVERQTVTLLAVKAPSAPRSPTATPRNTAVRLTWLAPSSNGGAKIGRYRVQRATSAKGPWKTIAKPTVRRYRAGGLTNGKKYFFRIAARNAAGWSTPSRVVSAVPRTVPKAPRSPKAMPANASVKLTWLAPSSNGGAKVDKYRVQKLTSGVWKGIASPTSRSYNVPGLTNGTKYSFRILAHNAAGWSPASTVVSAIPRTVPSAPQWPGALAGAGSVSVTWAAPASDGGATTDLYKVQQATNPPNSWQDVYTTPTMNYMATPLNNGTTYYFRILARNAAGWGSPSTVVSATPKTVPTVPQSLTATVGKDYVHLTWNPPASDGGSPVKYLVQTASSKLGPWTAKVDTTTLYYTANGLTPGTGHFFRVIAHNDAGNSAPTAPAYGYVPTLPSKPATCTATQLYGAGSDWVRVQWTPPIGDGGAPILYYKIRIQDWYATVHATAQPVGNATTWDIYMPADSGATEQNGIYYYNMLMAAHNVAGDGPMCGNALSMEP